MISVSLVGSVIAGTRSLRAQLVRDHEVIEMVESYLEYRFRPTEGMSL
jgi:hypothetical protein